MADLFRRSTRNRRRDTGVTLFAETGDSTVGRRRGRWWSKPLVFVLLTTGLVVGSGFALRLAKEHWLYQVQSLALRKVDVTRDGVLTEDEISRLAGVQPGRNVMTIDVFAMRQRLLRHPRIEAATVALEYPDTLRISVRERVPVARVLLPPMGGMQACYLLDDSGHVLLPFDDGRAPEGIIAGEAALPTLTGMKAPGFSAGQAVTNPLVLAALTFLTGFDASPVAAVTEVVSVDVSQQGVLTALTPQGSQVTLTPDDLDRQLREWRAVHDRAAELTLEARKTRPEAQFSIGTLDLSVRGNPPLRWLEAAAAPAASPSLKPAPPKRRPSRRHV